MIKISNKFSSTNPHILGSLLAWWKFARSGLGSTSLFIAVTFTAVLIGVRNFDKMSLDSCIDVLNWQFLFVIMLNLEITPFIHLMKILTLQGPDIVIGNVGDSRAVLATREKDNSLVAVQLTVDLKPDLPSLSLSLSLAYI